MPEEQHDNNDQQAELRLARLLADAQEAEREITSGFDPEQLAEGDPCHPSPCRGDGWR